MFDHAKDNSIDIIYEENSDDIKNAKSHILNLTSVKNFQEQQQNQIENLRNVVQELAKQMRDFIKREIDKKQKRNLSESSRSPLRSLSAQTS